jgi:hypothetical protein
LRRLEAKRILPATPSVLCSASEKQETPHISLPCSIVNSIVTRAQYGGVNRVTFM